MQYKKSYNIAVVGCTGMVGKAMIKCLECSAIVVNTFIPLASSNSVGNKAYFKDKEYDIQDALKFNFEGVDFALFATEAILSEQLVKKATKSGCICIDNSSFFRLQDGIPLIVPSVNPEALSKDNNIIANPNCSTIQLVTVLKELSLLSEIKRVVVSTYQSVSGAGKDAMDELYYQTKKMFTNENHPPKYFTKQIAFNCIPHIDDFTETGDTKEEIKIKRESMKIMNNNNLKISATCVRVPVFVGHCESVNIEFKSHVTEKAVYEVLSESDNVIVLDRRENSGYATPIDIVNDYTPYVSRIRIDDSTDNAINLWIVADNVYCGAASNAVEILNLIIGKEQIYN